MSAAARLARHLGDQLREESAALERAEHTLDDGLARLRGGSPADVRELAAGLERHLAGALERDRRRQALVTALAKRWEVAPGTLTLASIAERLGPDAEGLVELRAELRRRLARIARTARRLSSLARLQHGLFTDVLTAVLDEHTGRTGLTSGSLVDAEA